MLKLSSITIILSVFLISTPVAAYSPQWFATPVANYSVPTRARQTVHMTYRANSGLIVDGKQVTTRKVSTRTSRTRVAPSNMPREWPDWIGMPRWLK
ncbi:MAG: hypothetical protein KAS32_21505 [Candidatus Peribacteraceae bacterium]|nr:hypothetical protein [Candidatus Peribacteraceae bacterium]